MFLHDLKKYDDLDIEMVAAVNHKSVDTEVKLNVLYLQKQNNNTQTD